MHVIGTAGHVDHGKSALVKALTGIDPDRLAEEKAREMTIDLGFAWLTLGDEEVGIVDVPGHRDFIENMLAGVGGIDLALLVIAADEGVMPQTREHLAILDLLEIKHGIVALTKCDLIDEPDWLDLVILEVTDLLQGTSLAGASILPVSARTGVGIAGLKQALANALQTIGQPPDWNRPRLPIDRVFSLPGFGTVVTGTLIGGDLQIGEEVEIQPGNLPGRIRGLQTHKTKREIARPGNRVAINITGVSREELRRGQVVAKRGFLRDTQLLDAQYRQLHDVVAPLTHNEVVKLFIGSAEVQARARIIGREEIPPGYEGWIQLALVSPVAVDRGDRFILRRPSPGTTLGGGHVLDPHPGRRHRRFRPDVNDHFRALAQGTPEEILLTTLSRLGPLQQATLFEKSGLAQADGQLALRLLINEGRIVSPGKLVVATSTWQTLLERVPVELSRYHRDSPLRIGMDREELRSRLGVPPAVFNPLQQTLIEDGRIVESGTLLRLPEHQVKFTVEEQQAIDQLMALFQSQGTRSPSVKECKAIVGDATYFALVDMGQIRPVGEDVVYSAETYHRLIQQLTDLLNRQGSITASEARDVLGASRKYTIALLEHMDQLHITRRSGDVRLPVRPLST